MKQKGRLQKKHRKQLNLKYEPQRTQGTQGMWGNLTETQETHDENQQTNRDKEKKRFTKQTNRQIRHR